MNRRLKCGHASDEVQKRSRISAELERRLHGHVTSSASSPKQQYHKVSKNSLKHRVLYLHCITLVMQLSFNSSDSPNLDSDCEFAFSSLSFNSGNPSSSTTLLSLLSLPEAVSVRVLKLVCPEAKSIWIASNTHAPKHRVAVLQFPSSQSASSSLNLLHHGFFDEQRPDAAVAVLLSSVCVNETWFGDTSIPAPIRLRRARSGSTASETSTAVSVGLPTCPKCLTRLDTTVTSVVPRLPSSFAAPPGNLLHDFPASSTESDLVQSATDDPKSLWKFVQSSRFISQFPCRACELLDITSTTATGTPVTKQQQSPIAREHPSSPSLNSINVLRCAVPDCDPPELTSDALMNEYTRSLWVCLHCGIIHCSRYRGAHGEVHWKRTGHRFACEVAHRTVWDYSVDAFAHAMVSQPSTPIKSPVLR